MVRPAFSYRTLDKAAREAIRDQRVAQFEQEHYSHDLNRLAVESSPDVADRQDELDQIAAAQETLEAAIEAVTSAPDEN